MPRPGRHGLLGALVCVALAVVFLTSASTDDRPLPGTHAPHRYSDYDPAWTQLVFPRLGSPLMPATSPTGLLTKLAEAAPGDSSRLAMLAAVAQAATLALFWVVALEIGVGPLPAAVALIALGLEPAFFGVATRWTPYLALPALVLAGTVARLRWLETGSRWWLVLLSAALAGAVAESVCVVPLVVPLMWNIGRVERGQRRSRTSDLWLPFVVITAGVVLQVVGAAAAWRDALLLAGGPMPWRDAVVAATSRWGRLLELYALSPVSEIVRRLRDDVGALDLLAPMLAVVGLLHVLRANRRQGWLLLQLAAVTLGIDMFVQAPAAALSPGQPLLAVFTLMAAAAGLSEIGSRFSRPTVAVVCFGVILAADGAATTRLRALDKSAGTVPAFEKAVAALPRPSAIVASDVEIDRRLEPVLESPIPAARIARIPQTSVAIAEVHRSGAPVFVWLADVPRVASLGWLLASSEPSDSSAVLYETIAATVCVPLASAAAVDIAGPLESGSIAMQAERASAYEVEIEGDGLPDIVPAIDVVAGRPIAMVRRDSTHLLLAAARGRRMLPRLDFPFSPDRARARLLTSDPAQHVRLCGAPVRGEAIRLRRDGEVSLPIVSRMIFERGWHAAEPTGPQRSQRWSDGAAGFIVLQLPGDPSELEVVVEALPAAPVSRAPTLTLDINGHALPALPMLPGARPYRWKIARESMRRGLNLFRLSVPEAFSPRSLGVSEDDRRLGFALSDFRLHRVE